MQVFPPTTNRFRDNQRITGRRGIVDDNATPGIGPESLLSANLLGDDGTVRITPDQDNPSAPGILANDVDSRAPGFNDIAASYKEGSAELPNEPGNLLPPPLPKVAHGRVSAEPGGTDTSVLVVLRDESGTVSALMKIPVGTTYAEVVPKLVTNTPVTVMLTPDGEWILVETLTSYDDIRAIFSCP